MESMMTNQPESGEFLYLGPTLRAIDRSGARSLKTSKRCSVHLASFFDPKTADSLP